MCVFVHIEGSLIVHDVRERERWRVGVGSNNTDTKIATTYVETAKELLKDAQSLCDQPFHNAHGPREAVNESIKLLRKSWYEEVTPEEIQAIKAAMVSGPRGIRTNAGHW